MKSRFKSSSILFWIIWIFMAACTICISLYVIDSLFTEINVNEVSSVEMSAGTDATDINVTTTAIDATPDTIDIETVILENPDSL